MRLTPEQRTESQRLAREGPLCPRSVRLLDVSVVDVDERRDIVLLKIKDFNLPAGSITRRVH